MPTCARRWSWFHRKPCERAIRQCLGRDAEVRIRKSFQEPSGFLFSPFATENAQICDRAQPMAVATTLTSSQAGLRNSLSTLVA